MSNIVSMANFEAAINRCLAAHPPMGHALGADATVLADVYGQCIYAGATEVDLAHYPEQAATIRKWLA